MSFPSLTTKSIEQEIEEIFLALYPRTEVQNKAYARCIHQACEAVPIHWLHPLQLKLLAAF